MLELTVVGIAFSWLLYGPFLKESDRAEKALRRRFRRRQQSKARPLTFVRY